MNQEDTYCGSHHIPCSRCGRTDAGVGYITGSNGEQIPLCDPCFDGTVGLEVLEEEEEGSPDTLRSAPEDFEPVPSSCQHHWKLPHPGGKPESMCTDCGEVFRW